MTGARLAIVATLLGIVAAVEAVIAQLIGSPLDMAAAGVMMLYALLLAVISLRDR